MRTSPVVGVNPDLCINCHQCIAVCPVKYCLDGSGETVRINSELCIGCGSCIDACQQDSRYFMDDWNTFIENRKRKKYVAIVAPSAAASFSGSLLKLNGFFKSLGVKAFFDVSFGAELTVRSYLEHLKEHSDSFMIAQPCPVIVNYMELYQPGLLGNLAPIDSPMMHTVKMVREFYPEYSDCSFIAVSPCISKKTEFEALEQDVLNLTFISIEKYMKEKGLSLSSCDEVPYSSPLAERAVLFSSPGGLKDTVEREAPHVMSKIRKIEGIHSVYDYFKSLEEVKDRDGLPLLIDCLNCEKGCNGGTGTGCRDFPRDLLESAVQNRSEEAKKVYSSKQSRRKAVRVLGRVVDKYWKPDLYSRSYTNRSGDNLVRTPDKNQQWEIFHSMLKSSEKDLYNCASCGYNSCSGMAKAIFNGLNKAENCHHYQIEMLKRGRESVVSAAQKIESKVQDVSKIVLQIADHAVSMHDSSSDQVSAVEESSAAIQQMIASILNADNLVKSRHEQIHSMKEGTADSADILDRNVRSVDSVFQSVDKIQSVNKTINSVAANTNLLSMNAAIEAAHAGNAGSGFAVVAGEIRKLATETAQNAQIIAGDLTTILKNIEETRTSSKESSRMMEGIVSNLDSVTGCFTELSRAMTDMSEGTEQVSRHLDGIMNGSRLVDDHSRSLREIMNQLRGHFDELLDISRESSKAFIN